MHPVLALTRKYALCWVVVCVNAYMAQYDGRLYKIFMVYTSTDGAARCFARLESVSNFNNLCEVASSSNALSTFFLSGMFSTLGPPTVHCHANVVYMSGISRNCMSLLSARLSHTFEWKALFGWIIEWTAENPRAESDYWIEWNSQGRYLFVQTQHGLQEECGGRCLLVYSHQKHSSQSQLYTIV